MKKVIKWLTDFGAWIKPLVILFVTVLLYFAVNCVLRKMDITAVNSLQMTGLILQLLGSSCVIPSIMRRLNAELPAGVCQTIIRWMKNIPRLRSYFRTETKDATVFAPSADFGISYEGVSVSKSSTSIEERLTILEKNYDTWVKDLQTYQKTLGTKLNDIMTDFKSNKRQTDSAIDEIKSTLMKLNREGLEWEIVGAIWLILGLLFATIGTMWF